MPPTRRCSAAVVSTVRSTVPRDRSCSPNAARWVAAQSGTRSSPSAIDYGRGTSSTRWARYGTAVALASPSCSHRATGARWNWPPNARSNRSPFLRSAAAHTGTRCAWRLRSLWPPFAASRDSRCSRRYCSPALAQTCTKRMKRHWLRRRTKRSSSAVVGGRRNRFLGHLEDLAQVGDVRGIVVHRLGWLVADLGDRLAV